MADPANTPPVDLQNILRSATTALGLCSGRSPGPRLPPPCVPLASVSQSFLLPGNPAHCSGALFPLPLPALPVAPIEYHELLKDLKDDFQDPAPRPFLNFPELATVEVRCADGRICKAEPALLARMGPALQTLLYGGKFTESLQGKINFPTIELPLFTTVYNIGLQEFFPAAGPPTLENFSAAQLVAMLRFAHTYEMKFVCAKLRRNILLAKPDQLFFDADGELELDMQKPLLRQLIRTLAEPLKEIPTFSNPEIYAALWPSIFPVGRMISQNFFTLQSNFVKSLLRSKLADFDLRAQPLAGVHELLLVELADSLPDSGQRAALLRQGLLERNESHPYSAGLAK